jgi:hypothetical protein
MVVTDYDALSKNDTFLVKFILRSDSITQIDFVSNPYPCYPRLGTVQILMRDAGKSSV